MRHLKLFETVVVTLLLSGALFYSHLHANTVSCTRITKDVGAKISSMLSYYEDDDDSYDFGGDYDDDY